MNILVIGNGGREHAICDALRKSPKVDKIYCIKGNAGTAEFCENIDLDYCNINLIGDFIDSHRDIEFTVIAPDDPLALGLADELEKRGHRVFGPKKDAAMIEASKVFSKSFMKKYNIPTAESEAFSDFESAKNYLQKQNMPIVIKADGLALGKGVLICQTLTEAENALKQIMLDKAFGNAGNNVVIEEYMTGKEFNPGEEVSVLAFTDGKTIVPMITSCDHKRAKDGDKGLNTGGMGTFAPCPFYDKQAENEIMQNILIPAMQGMVKEGRTFKGVLYAGLMRTKQGYKVVEFNARFGDPETQVVLPMLKTDLLTIFEAVESERLSDIKIEWDEGVCVCVVLASGGYPVKYEKYKEITINKLDDGIIVYHAGTAIKDGKIVTNGGRVLNVCAKGKTYEEARKKVYANLKNIYFEGMEYRNDIGIKYQKN